MNSIKYATLPSRVATRLAVLCVQIEAEIPYRVCLLYKDALVWTALSTFEETYQVYDYLVDPDIGKHDDGFVNQVKPKGEALISNHADASSESFIKKIFRQSNKKSKFSGVLIGGTDKLKMVCIGVFAERHSLVVYQVS